MSTTRMLDAVLSTRMELVLLVTYRTPAEAPLPLPALPAIQTLEESVATALRALLPLNASPPVPPTEKEFDESTIPVETGIRPRTRGVTFGAAVTTPAVPGAAPYPSIV